MKKVKRTIFIVIIMTFLAGAAFSTFKYLNIEIFKSGGSGGSVMEEKNAEPDSKQTYENNVFGFSFRYPLGFKIIEIPEDLGTTILAEKSGTRESFQIFISEFDEPGPITGERIKKDLPDIVMENPLEILIGEGKTIRALIFFVEDAALGKTREVWFVWPDDPSVAGNYLYQITTYPEMDNLIGPILDTLKF